ncbi:MAG: hypothetical protein GF418_17415 [Chitinivibrionales bacterium]|nr:hypothetical protein [Chitinivibrionales bacterium]MBD3397400.1 hypothetical protein [Chitinivibrionales bacterium]
MNKRDRGDGETKKEMFESHGLPYIMTAAIMPEERDRVVGFFESFLGEVRDDAEGASMLGTRRQEDIARGIAEHLRQMSGLGKGAEEIAAYHARQILGLLGQFIGESSTEEMLDAIFNEFCIGK